MVTLGDVFYPLAATYQLALAVLIAITGRLAVLRLALVLVLGLNALQLFAIAGLTAIPLVWAGPLDAIILVTLPFILLHFPRPAGGARGTRLAERAWVAAIIIIVGFAAGRALYLWDLYNVGRLGHDVLFTLGLAVAAIHTIPALARTRPGPGAHQSSLVAAGIVFGLLQSSGRIVFDYLFVVEHDAFTGRFVTDALYHNMLLFHLAGWAVLVAATWTLTRPQARHVRWVLWVVLFAFAAGAWRVARVNLGWADDLPAIPTELGAQVVRPALIGFALLRYDLFRIPRRIGRPAVFITLALLAITLFLLVSTAADGASLDAAQLSPGATLFGLTVVAFMLYLTRGPIEGLAAAPGMPSGRDREARYLLALERYQGAQDPIKARELVEIRRRLGISRKEHDEIANRLADHVLVPVSALRGLRPGTLVGERWKVTEIIGEGGQGRAARAVDTKTGEAVVVKEAINPWEADADDRLEALRHEARVGAAVTHPALARTLDIIETPWQHYLVREYVPGRTVEEIVASDGPAPLERGLHIARVLASGVAALHAAGLLHLDLKPANVVVRDDGGAVLIDQGTSRPTVDVGEQTAVATGTPVALSRRWAAPERLRGGRPDERSDVYEVAGLIFHLLTGRYPSPDDDDPARANDTWPKGLPGSMRDVLRAARAPEAAGRPGSAQEMLHGLQEP